MIPIYKLRQGIYLTQVPSPGLLVTWTCTIMVSFSYVPLSKVGCPMSATVSSKSRSSSSNWQTSPVPNSSRLTSRRVGHSQQLLLDISVRVEGAGSRGSEAAVVGAPRKDKLGLQGILWPSHQQKTASQYRSRPSKTITIDQQEDSYGPASIVRINQEMC